MKINSNSRVNFLQKLTLPIKQRVSFIQKLTLTQYWLTTHPNYTPATPNIQIIFTPLDLLSKIEYGKGIDIVQYQEYPKISTFGAYVGFLQKINHKLLHLCYFL